MVDSRGSGRFAVLFFALAFGLLLFGRWLGPIDAVALTVMAPFSAVINGVVTTAGDTASSVIQAPRIQQENARLRRQNAFLLGRNLKMQEALHENAYLRTLVKFDRRNSGINFLTSRVIMNDPNTLGQNIIIDAGARDGVKPNMTVVSQGTYFAGVVTEVEPTASKVQLMTNPSSTVGAYDLQTRAQGLVYGRYGGLPQLRYVPTSSRLRVGDFVRTSGQANLFPRGILLGQIVAVHRRNQDIVQTADLQPATDFNNMEVVQIVRNYRPNVPVKLLQGP